MRSRRAAAAGLAALLWIVSAPSPATSIGVKVRKAIVVTLPGRGCSLDIVGDLAVFASPGLLQAVNARSGSVVWSAATTGPVQPPHIVRDTVWVVESLGLGRVVVRRSTRDGKTLGRIQVGEGVEISHDRTRSVVLLSEPYSPGSLTAYNPEGQKLWSKPGVATIAENVLLWTGVEGELIDPLSGRSIRRVSTLLGGQFYPKRGYVVTGTEDKDPTEIRAVDLNDGKALWTWRFPGSITIWASTDTSVLGVEFLSSSSRNAWTSVDPSTGRTLWRAKIPGRPSFASGRLYSLSASGVSRIDEESGSVMSSIPSPPGLSTELDSTGLASATSAAICGPVDSDFTGTYGFVSPLP